MTKKEHQSQSNFQVGRDLAKIIQKTEELFDKAGYSRKPTTLDVWGMFDQLPKKQCLGILDAAETRYRVPKSAIIHNTPFDSNKKSLKATLKELNLNIHDDVYDRLNKDMVVDIYNHNYLQIYHNKAFNEVCNFSYLELSALPWFELFERPSYCTLYLFQQAEELFLSDRKEPVEIELDDYCLREKPEKLGQPRLECVVHHEFVCPATNEADQVKALVYANTVKGVIKSGGRIGYL